VAAPAPKQFKSIGTATHASNEPDFVVEATDTIYLTEIKADNQIDQQDVREKARAALQYCKHASDYNQKTAANLEISLIHTVKLLPNMSFSYLRQSGKFLHNRSASGSSY